MLIPHEISLKLPSWIDDEQRQLASVMPSLEDRMACIIRFSRLNIEHNTGGPFAAGVFEQDTGRMVCLSVNRVIDCNCSSAHAEVMALSLAQQLLGHWDLGSTHMPAHQLVVNWQPCTMCYGAIIWSGIRSLVIAGSGPELENITRFDEGPTHPEWKVELEKRGIDVTENILKESAIDVFKQFRKQGHVVYNARQGDPT